MSIKPALKWCLKTLWAIVKTLLLLFPHLLVSIFNGDARRGPRTNNYKRRY